ncbi:KH domain-containing protein [Bdellovibrio sp. NC01]|uniref:KH domain-containing protein n=1 Tax=Bdellovibrio sp. NC01 TaxID=2220073 RepID=UPI0011576E6D|nr:KH domain-containing protein [Bdellovibrio sp. NC01]QDK38058.1 hypothetical protein DOE51_10895 [Bdellovibrio sp. NC01]
MSDVNIARTNISEIITTILNSLLSTTAKFEVSYFVGPQTTVFMIDVQQSDFGRLLGAKGKNIGSLRTLVAAMAANNGFRGIVQIKDEEKFLIHRG